MAEPFSSETKQQTGISGKVLLAAAAVITVLVVVVAMATLHRPSNGSVTAGTYAANLSISGIELSEATNGAGGKVTYVDGSLKNNGSKTLEAATVQVTFVAEDGSASAAQTVPLTLVRTREPYVDIESIAAEPLPPGSAHAFRLIFESVPQNWNRKEPAMRVVGASAR